MRTCEYSAMFCNSNQVSTTISNGKNKENNEEIASTSRRRGFDQELIAA